MYYNEKHKKIVESRGDNYKYVGSYKTKEKTLDDKNKNGNQIYIRVKCIYCENEYDIQLNNFKIGQKCKYCCNSYENSFAYYIQQELKEPLNEYWDWKENKLNPYHISKCTNKIIKIKCTKKEYHGTYSILVSNFHQGKRCPYCATFQGKVHPKDSFGQWLIDTYGEDAIEKYWSSKNTLDPFTISLNNKRKIWILCQNKNYHNDMGGYLTTPNRFYKGQRCGYCINRKIHPKDSFGTLYPQKIKYWSKNNKKSPFEVAPMSREKYRFICEKCGKEFERSLSKLNRTNTGVICLDCTSSSLEQITKNTLDNYNVKYEREYTYDNLIGINGGLLRFDFYLLNYNILIECQGEQHINIAHGWQTKEQFERQQIHDQLKKEYCEKNNIKLIEIWYYDIDNIEDILIKELNLI